MADYFFANRFSLFKALLCPLVGLISALWAGDCSAQVYYSATPSYYPYTIARPQDREWIRNLPMEQRPDRPLHFYGNWVRRTYTVRRPSYNAPAVPAQAVPTIEIQVEP
jgi:hypothetical protein